MSRLASDDLDRIMTVMEAAFDPAYGEAWNRRQVDDALAMPGTHYLLADPQGLPPGEGDPVAGFAMSRGAADEEELLLIAVRPEYRGTGVGGALMERFIRAAAARGANSLFLQMRDGNPAVNLYRRYGFSEIGRRRDYYRTASNGPIDAITFSRASKPKFRY